MIYMSLSLLLYNNKIQLGVNVMLRLKLAGEVGEAFLLFLASLIDKKLVPKIDSALDKRADKRVDKQMTGLKTNQKKATKKVITDLISITNKDYRESIKIRNYINQVRKNAPTDNPVVQELLRLITMKENER